ncbi:uncharacterized protein [Ptychodera flava]|uniref:uncharacterized protein n=1 Tax=Ptychodera flava TaxID=63121 RepID=UPI00396AA16C
MELVRTMSDHVTDSMNVNGEQGKQVFPSIANMPNLQHLYSPSPTKSHDSGVSLNKSTPHTDFDRLPRLVELSSATTKTDYRREATSIRTARLPKMSSNYGRRKQQEATTTAASTIVDDNTDTANQFNPDPMPYQAKNFRSSTMIRSVPLSRRHQESFGAVGPRLVKTKSVPFHTRPFLWDPVQRTHTSLLIESCQRNKFMEEEVHLEEVRGLKRKREVIPHRIQYTELSVDGATTKMHEKLDYAAELEKIKSVPVLPPECQELYTGRGIKLPPSHSSNKQPPPPPPVVIPMPQPPAMSRTNTFASQTDETKPPPDRDDRQESLKVQPPAKIKRQSTNMKRKDSKRKDSLNDSRESKRDSNSQEKKTDRPKWKLKNLNQLVQNMFPHPELKYKQMIMIVPWKRRQKRKQ